MFSTKRRTFLKPAGAARFFIGVATLLVLAAPAMRQTFAYSNYRTFTQGGWGAAPRGNNPGALRAANFTACGVVIGDAAKYTMTVKSAQAIENYLPAGGKANALNANVTYDPNPDETNTSGVFGG